MTELHFIAIKNMEFFFKWYVFYHAFTFIGYFHEINGFFKRYIHSHFIFCHLIYIYFISNFCAMFCSSGSEEGYSDQKCYHLSLRM